MFMFFKVLTLSLFYSKLSLKYKTDYLIGMNTDNMNKSFSPLRWYNIYFNFEKKYFKSLQKYFYTIQGITIMS